MEPTDIIDLAGLRMAPGEGRRLELPVALDAIRLSEQGYAPEPAVPEVRLDISRMLGGGYALQLRFDTALGGPCMRCLGATQTPIHVDVRELEQKKRDPEEQFDSEYVDGDELQLARWTNDSFVFSLPQRILCREDCRGLCPECGENLNEHPEHAHERAPDSRLAALASIRFDEDGNLVQGS
ncbi:YceD family protein [Patulibacter sp. S7RM1-6]